MEFLNTELAKPFNLQAVFDNIPLTAAERELLADCHRRIDELSGIAACNAVGQEIEVTKARSALYEHPCRENAERLSAILIRQHHLEEVGKEITRCLAPHFEAEHRKALPVVERIWKEAEAATLAESDRLVEAAAKIKFAGEGMDLLGDFHERVSRSLDYLRIDLERARAGESLNVLEQYGIYVRGDDQLDDDDDDPDDLDVGQPGPSRKRK